MQDIDRDLPAIWTVSVSRLSRLITDVVPEFDQQAQIRQLSLGFEAAARRLRSLRSGERCDVVIAAGSNGAYLRPRLQCPLVLVKANGFDLMRALAQARRVSPRIGLITHESEWPGFADFQQRFELGIEERSFTTAEEAREAVAELVAAGVQAIVGTGMVVDLADKAGVTGILLYSAQTIRTAFESALELMRVSQQGRTPEAAGLAGTVLPAGSQRLIGSSLPMQKVREQIQLYAPGDRTVLIQGETGTGKELVARALHAASPRSGQAFVAVNCGALADSLLESELFGYEEGSFTGARRGGRAGLIEAAEGGTLFLDEIGEMPLALQTRLLRVLEEREILRVGASRPTGIDVRVLAASHRDLDRDRQAGRFRADLFYRLNVLRIDLPPLREHREDLPELIQALLAEAGGYSLSPAALTLMLKHDWPGNVRELRNVLDRLLAHAGSHRRLDESLLMRWVPEILTTAESRGVRPAEGSRPVVTGGRPSAEQLEETLRQVGGNRQKAAALLGVSRSTLWRWLRDSR